MRTCTPTALDLPGGVAQYGTWEASLTAAAGVNPFDAAEVQVACQLQSPSGRSVTAPGFYYQGYRRSLDAGGRERLQAEGPAQWRVRFAPAEPGVWSYRVTVAQRGGSTSVPGSGTFTVTASPGGGWIKVDAVAPHRFMIVRAGQETLPFIPVGENMCWSEAGGTYDYDRWLPALAVAGGNYVRLWVNEFPSSFGVEGGGGAVGDYRDRMDRAWALDYVLNLAWSLGIRCTLCLLWHGAFSRRVNPAWSTNPYNAANGGPCASPSDFFTNATARDLFKRRLNYVVGRWSSHPAVFSWEFWNEVDWVDDYRPEPVRQWHAEMSAYLKSIDLSSHLVTTSYKSVGDPVVWEMPTIDYVQLHNYTFPEVAQRISHLVSQGAGRYAKPVLFGEFGIDWRSGQDQVRRDPLGRSLHEAIWATVFAGAAGAAMTWWWDSYIEQLDLYRIFRSISRFIAAGDIGEMHPEDAAQPVRVMGTLGIWTLVAPGGRRALWIKDLDASWERPGSVSVQPAQRPLFVPDGEWRLQWFDTGTGEACGSPILLAAPNARQQVSLDVPTFKGDIAALINPAR